MKNSTRDRVVPDHLRQLFETASEAGRGDASGSSLSAKLRTSRAHAECV
jgi:hypothetical protein